MNALVVGGAASGKSHYAEQLACRLSPVRTYLATMSSEGTEARARIARHQAQRAGLGFATIECPGSLSPALPHNAPAPGVALLDDLGNLVANALFVGDTMASPEAVLEELTRELAVLSRSYEHVVVVGNEVGSDGPSPYEGTQAWIRLMGALCCRIAASFDTVIEVSCSRPTIIKGSIHEVC